MRLKGLIAAGALGSTVFLSASLLLDLTTVPTSNEDGTSETFALAPLSVGHPAAAATLKTRRYPRTQGAPTPAADVTVSERHKVRRGDILAKVLSRAGVDAGEAETAIAAFTKVFDPRKLRAGDEIEVLFKARPPVAGQIDSAPGAFTGFAYAPNSKSRIAVRLLTNGKFEARTEMIDLDPVLTRMTGTITSSLYVAGSRAGLPQKVLAEMIKIYSWDVDFQRDIRRGDRFEVLYEEMRTKDGRAVDTGRIHFASLSLSGQAHSLYRFVTDGGSANYFDGRGQGARKALLRTPIDGARLSSGFGKRRHPILGYTRLHKGVDFAAPTGTPIYAAGDGVVATAGRNGGYGNYIRIRHNGRFATAYAHLSRFAKGVKSGTRVRQGQVIGYVGSTGRSTGPHLHYEIIVAGKPANPMRVKMPSGKKLKGRELERFMEAKARIDRQYALLEPTDGRLAAKK